MSRFENAVALCWGLTPEHELALQVVVGEVGSELADRLEQFNWKEEGR